MTGSVPERRIQTICLLILSAAAIAFAIYWLQPVLIPVVLAFMLTMVLNPVVEFLIRRMRTPRWLAVLITLLLAFVALAGLSLVVSIAIAELTDNISLYQNRVESMTNEIIDALPLATWKIDPDDVRNALAVSPSDNLSRLLLDALRAVLNIASQAVLVLIFLFFLLAGQTAASNPTDGIWSQITRRVKKYLILKTFLSLVTGILIWSALAVLNVKLALVFGLLAFLLNYIPSIGSIIATLLPAPLVFLNPEVSVATAVLALAIPGLIQFVIGNLIEPRMMGRSLDLHPVTILAALIFWGTMWGVIGMLLAVPITASLAFLLEQMEITAPIGRLLKGQAMAAPAPNGSVP